MLYIKKTPMFASVSQSLKSKCFDYVNDKGKGNDRKAATSTDLQLKPTSVFT